MGCCISNHPKQYTLLETVTKQRYLNTKPGISCINPFHKPTKKRAIDLLPHQYVVVTNIDTLDKRIEKGQQEFFPGEWDEVSNIKDALELSPIQYVHYIDVLEQKRSEFRGPGLFFLPSPYHKIERRLTAMALKDNEWVRIENFETGELRIEKGENVLYLTTEEKSSKVQDAIQLGPTDYVHVKDTLTGDLSQVRGPGLWFPKTAYEKVLKQLTAIALKENEWIRLENIETGELRIDKGELVVYLTPEEISSKVHAAIKMGPTDYIHVQDTLTGDLIQITGPGMWFPKTPYDKCMKQLTAITLRFNEYVKVEDLDTGKIRVIKGEDIVYLECRERIMDIDEKDKADTGVKTAPQLDEETSVLIRAEDGQMKLICGTDLFFPTPYEIIDELRPKILLEDHETMILVKPDGEFLFVSGDPDNLFMEGRGPDQPEKPSDESDEHSSDGAVIGVMEPSAPDLNQMESGSTEQQKELAEQQISTEHLESKGDSTDRGNNYVYSPSNLTTGSRGFFLPPYHEIKTLFWSEGPEMTKRTRQVQRVDGRPCYTNYEFICRTKDNVELFLDITFFWQVVAVPNMIRYTDDAPGDLCHHARSEIIRYVSQVSLEAFMNDFDAITSRAIGGGEDTFLSDRGLKIHQVEVRSMSCKDPAIEKVLQQIIQETTNKMNRLQKQESENEVRLCKLKGDILEEKMMGELLDIQQDHKKTEAVIKGESEAERVATFLHGIERAVPDPNTRMEIFNVLRRNEVLDTQWKSIGSKMAKVYLTPGDVSLYSSLEGFGDGDVGENVLNKVKLKRKL